MINELQTRLYLLLRDTAGLTQAELGAASGLSRRTIQRIETAERLPTRDEEEAIQMATDSTDLFLAELVCQVLSQLLGRRVSIGADETGYRAATPEAELNELLRVAQPKMRRERWWAWKERVGRFKALGQLHETQGLADVRDLAAEVKALCREEEEAGESPAAS